MLYQMHFRRDWCLGWQVGPNAFQGPFKETKIVSLPLSRISNRGMDYMLIFFLNVNLQMSVHTLTGTLCECIFM